jgi:hypothetical protein
MNPKGWRFLGLRLAALTMLCASVVGACDRGAGYYPTGERWTVPKSNGEVAELEVVRHSITGVEMACYGATCRVMPYPGWRPERLSCRHEGDETAFMCRKVVIDDDGRVFIDGIEIGPDTFEDPADDFLDRPW